MPRFIFLAVFIFPFSCLLFISWRFVLRQFLSIFYLNNIFFPHAVSISFVHYRPSLILTCIRLFVLLFIHFLASHSCSVSLSRNPSCIFIYPPDCVFFFMFILFLNMFPSMLCCCSSLSFLPFSSCFPRPYFGLEHCSFRCFISISYFSAGVFPVCRLSHFRLYSHRLFLPYIRVCIPPRSDFLLVPFFPSPFIMHSLFFFVSDAPMKF